MKHLLYLNRDYLYSYYAQAYDGIDHTRTKGVTDATASAEERISETVQRTYGGGFNLFHAIEGKGEKQVTEENINMRYVTLEAAREVATITLHDNALNQIIDHSRANQNHDRNLGSYVVEKGHFDLIDFRYWIDMLSDSFINSVAERTWEEHLKKLSNPNAKEVQSGRKTFIQNEKDKLNDAKKNFAFQEAILQCDVVMIVNNILIPIKREFMKESTREMLFKYESPVSVFGRVTRTSRQNPNNSIGALKQVNASLTSLWVNALQRAGTLNTDDSYTVIDPIAIYVE